MYARSVTLASVMCLLAAPSHGAEPTPFCKALEIMFKAGMEKTPFASVTGKVFFESQFHGTLRLPGFGRCFANPRSRWPSYSCHIENLTPSSSTSIETKMKAELESCTGEKMWKDLEVSLAPWVIRQGPNMYPYMSLLRMDKQIDLTLVMPKVP